MRSRSFLLSTVLATALAGAFSYGVSAADGPDMPKVAVTPVQSSNLTASSRDLTERPVRAGGADSLMSRRQVDEAPRAANAAPNRAANAAPAAAPTPAPANTAKAAPAVAAPKKAPEPIAQTQTVVGAETTSAASRAMQDLREENTRLRNALERERRNFENSFQSQSVDSPAVTELTEKVRLLETRNEDLNARIAQLSGSRSAKAEQATCATVKDPEKDEAVTALRTQVEKLNAENAALKSSVNALEADKVSRAPATTSAADGAELKKLRDENAVLKTQLATLTAQKETPAVPAKVIPTKEDEATMVKMAELNALLKKAQDENVTLRQRAIELESKSAGVERDMKADMELLARLRTAEEDLLKTRADRDRLAAALVDAEKTKADPTKIANANWNLEQATNRFNQAELETRRLGALLDEERAKCTREKRELEHMLFDPKIADREQIARMARLEEELAVTKKKLGQGAPAVEDPRVARLERDLAAALSRADANEGTQNADMVNALRAEISELRAQVKSLETEKATMRSTAQAAAAPAVAQSRVQIEPVDSTPIHASAKESHERFTAPVTAAAATHATLAGGRGRLVTAPALENVLRKSGLTLTRGVQSVANATDANNVAYRWEAGQGVFGSAEQTLLPSLSQYDANVQEYLKRTEGRCRGEFAAIPAAEGTLPGGRVSTYEIACMDGTGAGASAALLFAGQDDVFTVVAHEAAPDAMETAMEARDRLVAGLQSN